MIATDEAALECDLAETYRIYDYRALPPTRVALFSIGLRENSRIKLIMSGQKEPLDTLLLASIVDRLTTLVWFKTKDGQNGVNRPNSLVAQMMEISEKPKEIQGFDSPEDFEAAMQRILSAKEV